MLCAAEIFFTFHVFHFITFFSFLPLKIYSCFQCYYFSFSPFLKSCPLSFFFAPVSNFSLPHLACCYLNQFHPFSANEDLILLLLLLYMVSNPINFREKNIFLCSPGFLLVGDCPQTSFAFNTTKSSSGFLHR